jgi:hypothetical protein
VIENFSKNMFACSAMRTRPESWSVKFTGTARTLRSPPGVTGLELSATATEAEVNAASANVLDDVRYFRVCQECEQRNSVGWMDDDRICQGCAASNHGVVY